MGQLLWASPAPAPAHPRAETPFGHALHAGVCGGAQGHAGGSEGHFSMHSSHGTLSPGLLWAEESGHVWGLGGPLSLTPAPGHPPSPHPACATMAAKPSALSPTGVAAPALWDDSGARPGARMGTAPGVLELPLGMAGFWPLGVAAGLLQLQGVREVRSGRGCRGVSATSLNPQRWDPAAAVTYCKYSVCHLLLWDPRCGRGRAGGRGPSRDFFVYHKLFVYF